MSINTYFNNKLPPELVIVIYAYANPVTTVIDDRIRKIVKDFSDETRFDAKQNWYQEIKEQPNYDNLWTIKQFVKIYYLPSKTLRCRLGGGHEKHYIECHKKQYVKRGDVVLAFMLSGYKYDVKYDTIYIYQKYNRKAINALEQSRC